MSKLKTTTHPRQDLYETESLYNWYTHCAFRKLIVLLGPTKHRICLITFETIFIINRPKALWAESWD